MPIYNEPYLGNIFCRCILMNIIFLLAYIFTMFLQNPPGFWVFEFLDFHMISAALNNVFHSFH